jgi:hypothetical protein
MDTKVTVTRIRNEYHGQLRELAAMIQRERGLRKPDLGLAAETAIAEALQKRKEAQKVSKNTKAR